MSELERSLSEQITGYSCRDFRLVEGGTLVLYFSQNYNELHSQKRLWIDCAWRLCVEEAIQIGSMDDSVDILNVLQKLVGLTLQTLSVSEPSSDLQLNFANGVVVETFGYSVASEHWEFRRADGLRIGLGPAFTPFERIETPDTEHHD